MSHRSVNRYGRRQAFDLRFVVERATRIELAFSAWEADVLPLNYARERTVTLPSALVVNGAERTSKRPDARTTPGARGARSRVRQRPGPWPGPSLASRRSRP